VVQSLEQVSAASVRCMIRRGWQRKKKRGGGVMGGRVGLGATRYGNSAVAGWVA
jgi:hypothetical protein